MAEDGLPLAYLPYASERLEYMGMINTSMENLLHDDDRVEAVHPASFRGLNTIFYGKRVHRDRLYDIIRGELVTTELRLASPNDIGPEEKVSHILSSDGRIHRKTKRIDPDEVIVKLSNTHNN